MLKIAIITNKITPYRVPVFSRIAQLPGVRLHVIYSTAPESGRRWNLSTRNFEYTYLSAHGPREQSLRDAAETLAALNRFSPDVVVTDGFSLLHVAAILYAFGMRRSHVTMTEDTDISGHAQNGIHAFLRRLVYAKSQAHVAASRGGQRLFEHYQLPRDRCFTSCPCVDNESFSTPARLDRQYDFIFCGHVDAVNNPLFALEVAVQTAKKLRRRVRVLIVGDGGQFEIAKRAALLYPGLVDVRFFGAASYHELPTLYWSARICLLPTLRDPWGVANNEACAAGLPVIVSPYAGAADELVIDGRNGFVCDLDADLWSDKAVLLLTESDTYQKFSEYGRFIVAQYNFDNAAKGLAAACRHAAPHSAVTHSPGARKMKPKVLIVERQLLQYRVAFYNRLRTLLDKEGIELQLLIGSGTPSEVKKKNQVSLDWAIHIPTYYLLGTTLCWQPFGAYAKDADLVVVMHENKIIYNLWLLSFGRPKRLAFWGHGRNMQSSRPDGLKERFKRWTINKVDWWFAYTESSAALVTAAGFPRECTTIVQNAVDTEEMTAFCKQVTPVECARKRRELNLGDGPVALYLGSLYKEKRLGFLLDAAFRIRGKIPGFQLLVVGAGPEQELIESAARQYPWIHYLGPLQDQSKAVALVLADVMLNPGLVGLGILDSFASGTPMFTTDCGLHSPEISYLSSGTNGVMTSNDVNTYADAVIDVLQEPEAIARLSKGALSSAPRYTVDNMANRIRMGICACLSTR